MGEWAQLANTTGVAAAVLVAVGFAFWRLGKLIVRKMFGDPDATPPKLGFIDIWLSQQKDFFDSLKTHTAAQQVLCERHAGSLEAIATILESHDGAAQVRTATLEELMNQHTDGSIPGSTAEAIRHVRQMRNAYIATCAACRDLAAGERAEEIRRHCDGIEAILKEQA